MVTFLITVIIITIYIYFIFEKIYFVSRVILSALFGIYFLIYILITLYTPGIPKFYTLEDKENSNTINNERFFECDKCNLYVKFDDSNELDKVAHCDICDICIIGKP